MPRRSKNAAVAAMETSIENHVAGRIRLRRGLLGMSQSDLARTLGITFQQVQKYERGSNRVSVGKLFRLAEILDVPLTFFFDGLESGDHARMTSAAEPDADGQSPLLSRRELDLLRAWRFAPPEISDAVASLLRSITPGGSSEDDVQVAPAARPLPVAAPAPAAPAPVMGGAATPVGEGAPIVAPKRRGRPPKALKEAAAAAAAAAAATSAAAAPPSTLAPAAVGPGGRRRRNAVWDPSDIQRAARAKE